MRCPVCMLPADELFRSPTGDMVCIHCLQNDQMEDAAGSVYDRAEATLDYTPRSLEEILDVLGGEADVAVH